MSHTRATALRVLTILVSGAISLTPILGPCDETAIRYREGIERFSLSNVFFFAELERTNPAMLKAMQAKWSTRESQMVAEGLRKIPCLRQFANLFPTNVDFRYLSPEPLKPHLWTMQTGLYGRYLLRMEVIFRVDATWTNITGYEPPAFSLITYDDHPPETRGLSAGREFSRRTLTASDWTNLVAAGGDLAVIGFKASTNSPIKNFDLEWRHRKY